MNDKLLQVCRAFCIEGDMVSWEEIKIGNVNRTYKVNFVKPDGKEKSYMLQAVNTFVFKNPVQVMENIDRVTEHIHAKKPGAIALHFHHTRERKTYVFDENGFWRLFNYIASDTFNTCNDLQVVRSAGKAFGEFQMMLADYDASQLYETIPDFHNTRARYEKLAEDAAQDPCGKVGEVRAELEWLSQVRAKACELTALYERGELPIRVTHNDTKINNVLFDKKTREALVVIDLDTVMPGLVGHDFGDAIRFAANCVEEDCPQYEKAQVNLAVFESFTEGFLSRTAAALTQREIDTLALSCFALTVELAVRFLDDYILGSPYFKIRYPEHNLVRARCQIALAKNMLEQLDDMQKIVWVCAKKYA